MKPDRILSRIPVLALTGVLLLAAPAAIAGEKDETTRLDATKTGIEKVDRNSVPESVRRSLAEFRRVAAEKSDEAVALGRRVIADLRQAAAETDKRLEEMGRSARAQWAETRARANKMIGEAQAQLDQLSAAAAAQWNATREAIAEKLQEAANAISKASSKTSG